MTTRGAIGLEGYQFVHDSVEYCTKLTEGHLCHRKAVYLYVMNVSASSSRYLLMVRCKKHKMKEINGYSRVTKAELEVLQVMAE